MEKLLREAIDAIKGLKRQTQITVKRLYGWFLLHGQDSAGTEKALLTASDGEVYVLAAGRDASGNVQEFLVASAGEKYVLLAGRDASDNIQECLVATDGTLQVSSTSTSQSRTVVDAVAIPAAVADVWDPGTDNTDYFDIEFEIVPIDTSNDATGVEVGVDYGDSSGAIDRYFVRGLTVTSQEVGVRLGPYRIGGDDVIMAACDNADDAELHIYIVDEGTAN